VGPHELIPLDEPERWSAALAEVPHGHAHTWGFCRAIQLTSGLLTYLYRHADGPVCPLAERAFGGELDVTTPYGFGGFAGGGPPPDFADFARSRGWVCGYVALNPVFCQAGGLADVHVHNRLYVLDLRGDVHARLSQNRRRQLRDWPALAAGLEHDRERLADFLVAEQAGFFARRGAGSATDFTHATMAEIAALDNVIIVGAPQDGALESVAVFGYTAHAADYLFNVSVAGGERHAVHLIWSAVERLRELGVPSLNLGGGVREGDDLAEFKRRFGAADLPLESLRQVYRPDAYERLCSEAGVSADRSGWFPPYRAGRQVR
jgi:hypothetical protein